MHLLQTTIMKKFSLYCQGECFCGAVKPDVRAGTTFLL